MQHLPILLSKHTLFTFSELLTEVVRLITCYSVYNNNIKFVRLLVYFVNKIKILMNSRKYEYEFRKNKLSDSFIMVNIIWVDN